MNWVEIEGVWHELERAPWVFGNGWLVKTACGLTRSWDHVALDRLPGGGEEVCPTCTAPREELPAKKTRKKRT